MDVSERSSARRTSTNSFEEFADHERAVFEPGIISVDAEGRYGLRVKVEHLAVRMVSAVMDDRVVTLWENKAPALIRIKLNWCGRLCGELAVAVSCYSGGDAALLCWSWCL